MNSVSLHEALPSTRSQVSLQTIERDSPLQELGKVAIFAVRQKCGYALSATEKSSESHWFLQRYKAGLQPRDPEVPLFCLCRSKYSVYLASLEHWVWQETGIQVLELSCLSVYCSSLRFRVWDLGAHQWAGCSGIWLLRKSPKVVENAHIIPFAPCNLILTQT